MGKNHYIEWPAYQEVWNSFNDETCIKTRGKEHMILPALTLYISESVGEFNEEELLCKMGC
jgi:hypothetical protein